MVDEFAERHFSRLVSVIVDVTTVSRVHSQFPSHLDLCVGQMVALAGVNPRQHFLAWFLHSRSGRNASSLSSADNPRLHLPHRIRQNPTAPSSGLRLRFRYI